MAFDRTRRGAKVLKKRVRRIPSITAWAARAARHGVKQVRRQVRQVRYHAAVLLKGGVARHEDPHG
jgi:hypothetical protein